MQPKSPAGGDLGFLSPHRAGEEVFNLPSGPVAVPKYFLEFKQWTGAPVQDDYNHKAIIDWKGEPVFAELAVLRLFQENGWEGVWADSYRRKFRVGLPGVAEPVDLLPEQAQLIQTLKEKTGRSGGCWDVVVWKNGVTLFMELKRLKRDAVQNTQVEWLSAALALGCKTGSFGIVEWTL